MLSIANNKFKPLKLGTSITIPIPSVDRCKSDLQGLIGVVM